MCFSAVMLHFLVDYASWICAQNITEFIARMHAMDNKEPNIWQDFATGDFVVNKNNAMSVMRIGVDQAMEHLSRATKGPGGISGITSNPVTLLKFSLTAHALQRLSTEIQHLVNVSDMFTTTQHHSLSQANVTLQGRASGKIKSVLASCNMFHGTETSGEKHISSCQTRSSLQMYKKAYCQWKYWAKKLLQSS